MTYSSNTDIEPITDNDGQPYPDCLIINQPDLKSKPLLLGEGTLTLLFWGFWLYLWLPVVSMLAWWFGFQIFYQQMVALGGFDGFIQQLHVFTSGVALVSGAIAAWSLYNLKRFGRYDRRNNLLKTDMEQLAATFDLSERQLPEIMRAKRILFSFSEDAVIRKIDLSPGQQA